MNQLANNETNLYVPPSWRGGLGIPNTPNCLSAAHDALEESIRQCMRIQSGLATSKTRNLSHKEVTELVLELERVESEVHMIIPDWKSFIVAQNFRFE